MCEQNNAFPGTILAKATTTPVNLNNCIIIVKLKKNSYALSYKIMNFSYDGFYVQLTNNEHSQRSIKDKYCWILTPKILIN